jgi:putative ABC transport system permease protein
MASTLTFESAVMSDLRFALRRLIASPTPTIVVVLTLAVAVGATTVLYSTIDMIWHFLPIADRDGLVSVASVDPRRGEAARLRVSVPDLADMSAQSTTIAAFAGFQLGGASLTGVAVPDRVSTIRATTNLLTMGRSRSGRVRPASGWRSEARPRVVERMVISQGAIPVTGGGLVGLLGAIALAYATAGGMPEVDVRDPANYAGVLLSIALVALAANYLPARRASRVDPAMTLRAE